MDEFLRSYTRPAEPETVCIPASRFAELIQKKTIYEIFEVVAETSENVYETFKNVEEIFPNCCIEGCMTTAKGRVAIEEETFSQLACVEQNLYELYLMLDESNFCIMVDRLIKFFNTKRMAQGLAELVPVVERNDEGVVVGRTWTEEGALDA